MSYITISSQEKHTIFHSVHAFTHFQQHCFSKYWGDQCMGRPPHLEFWGDRPPSPPRSPPLGCINLCGWRKIYVKQSDDAPLTCSNDKRRFFARLTHLHVVI